MISVAMIVKNEIKTLESTINSIKDYTDEIVIGLDEESSDGTSEIVQRLADKVVTTNLSEELRLKSSKFDEENNNEWGFSKARNKVFEICKSDNWRLVLDGHEKLINPSNMHNAIKNAKLENCDGIEVMIRFEPNNDGIPRLMYKQGRLFDPSVRYNNPLHNVPIVSKSFFSNEFQIEHHKQNQDLNSKVERDIQRSLSTIDGFLEQIKINPKNSRSRFYLGNAYKENGKWEEAIETYKEYLKISIWKEERWHARTNMGICYIHVGDYINAREQFVQALEEFPVMVEAYYYLADLAYKQEKFREAQAWLETSINMPIPQCSLFVDPRIYFSSRYDMLAMVYSHLGRYEDAINQAKKAMKNNSDPRLGNNVKYWETLLGKNNG